MDELILDYYLKKWPVSFEVSNFVNEIISKPLAQRTSNYKYLCSFQNYLRKTYYALPFSQTAMNINKDISQYKVHTDTPMENGDAYHADAFLCINALRNP